MRLPDSFAGVFVRGLSEEEKNLARLLLIGTKIAGKERHAKRFGGIVKYLTRGLKDPTLSFPNQFKRAYEWMIEKDKIAYGY